MQDEGFSITIEQLRGLIGSAVLHQGVVCHIIEILEDGPSLVLEDQDSKSAIQNDQFGDPSRRVMDHYVVPVFSADRSGFHAAFLELDIL